MWDDASPQVANERVKRASGIFYNLATALLAACAARVYNDGEVTWPPTLMVDWRVAAYMDRSEVAVAPASGGLSHDVW